MDKINTKFYSTKSQGDSVVYKNYTRYNIFCLKAWLRLWVIDTLPKDIYIIIDEDEDQTDNHVTVSFTLNGEAFKLSTTTHQKLIENITNFEVNRYNWFPIFSSYDAPITEEGDALPQIWVKQMLNYIGVDKSYQPYISKEGLLINLSINPDYSYLTTLLSLNIQEKLISMYKQGFIFRPSLELINKWKLISHDIKDPAIKYTTLEPDDDQNFLDNSFNIKNYLQDYDAELYESRDYLLYKANWEDTRVIGNYKYITDFLISRQKGEQSIRIELKHDYYDRHMIASILNKINVDIDDYYFIEDKGIVINVKDYEDALNKVNNIYDYYERRADNKESIDIGFIKVKSKRELIENSVKYKTNDNERPYTSSFLIDKE